MKEPERGNLKIIYGYGFPVNNVTTDALRNFIKNHRTTIENNLTRDNTELLDAVDNNELIEDTFNNLPCYLTGNEGLRAIIANVIYAETNICFQYEPGDNNKPFSKESVVFTTAMPWELSDTEKNLNEDALFEICKKYMSELNILDESLGLQEIIYES